ncbi:MAG: type II secretion system protein [Campylobacterales bacterium]|nr:type II secretion system protein [Campylobacterales bacterium]
MNTKRSAFTMIELLFVIVILGIVGGFALEAIRNYYEGIYRTSEYTKRVAQADHILEQLSKYFENAISSSIVNLDEDNTLNNCKIPIAGDEDHDYTVAFIAVDTDSQRGMWNNTLGRYQPGWSEDVAVNENNITAKDANNSFAASIIDALGTSTLAESAIYNTDSSDVNACARFNLNTASGGSGFHTISSVPNTEMLSLNTVPAHGKRKYLLRTAYAFRVEDNGSFSMYTNFRPWRTPHERYDTYANVQQRVLGENVAHFYADYNATDFSTNPDLSDRGLVWRLKVCMQGLDTNLSTSTYEGDVICRERRVYVRY